MRKRVMQHDLGNAPSREQRWLDLEQLARVEITSEDAAHPIEAALIPGHGVGWRAAKPGEQTIRLVFDEPLSLRRVHLRFQEEERQRTQEVVLRSSTDRGQSYQEIVRQQYNFSPPVTSWEVEDYAVELDGVAAIELKIIPDISAGDAHASLAELRLA
jgi:hypothetical protein